jgi:cytoskeletal protein RodZ
VRRSSVKLPFLLVTVLLVVLVVIVGIGSCDAGGTSSDTLASDDLTSESSTTLPSDTTTSVTEGDTSSTEAETSTTENTSSTDDTSTTEDTSSTESTSTTAASSGSVTPGATYTADMSGSEVVPAVTTEATGKATFKVDDTGTKVSFTLSVSKMTDVNASRVHVGAAGSNGSGVVVLLAGRYGEGLYTGPVASGVFDASLLIGPLKGKTIADFVAMIERGEAYLTVGSAKNPNGEIRGQIK